MNVLALMCPCGHPAYLHRTLDTVSKDREAGKFWVGVCGGGGIGTRMPCCVCKVDRDTVIEAVG